MGESAHRNSVRVHSPERRRIRTDPTITGPIVKPQRRCLLPTTAQLNGKVFSTIWSPDDTLTLAAGGSAGKLQIWDIGANQNVRNGNRRVCFGVEHHRDSLTNPTPRRQYSTVQDLPPRLPCTNPPSLTEFLPQVPLQSRTSPLPANAVASFASHSSRMRLNPGHSDPIC